MPKDSFFYALVIVATLAVTRVAFLAELVEHAGAFASHAVEARQAPASDTRSKDRAIQVAEAEEKK